MKDRDPFAAAKDELLLRLTSHPHADENALKVAVRMIMLYANRKAFQESRVIVAYPSFRTLADETGLTKSRVQRGIERLELIGVLTVERPEKRGSTHHNSYFLNVAGIMEPGEVERRIGNFTAARSKKNVRTNVDNQGGENVRTGEDIKSVPIVRTRDGKTSAPVGPNLLENLLEGAGAPSGAPPAPFHGDGSHDDDDPMTRVEMVAGGRDHSPLPDHPDDDEIPWDAPEDDVEAEIEDTFDDVPEDQRAPFRTIADLIAGDPRAFVETVFAGFSGGDEDAAKKVVARIAERVHQMRQDGESPRSVLPSLVAALSSIATSRALCEEDVDVLTGDLIDALRFGVKELARGVNHG